MASESILGGSELVAFAPTPIQQKRVRFMKAFSGCDLWPMRSRSHWCSMPTELCCA